MSDNWYGLTLPIYNNYNFMCYKYRWNEKNRERKFNN